MTALDSSQPGGISRPWIVAGLALAAVSGATVGALPIAGFVVIALCCVVIGAIALERLAIVFFWTLPYMVANLPTGSLTLKLPEVVGYLFATAYFARAVIRKERVVLPPATLQMAFYLFGLAVATLLAPAVPDPFTGGIATFNRNSPALRPLSIIIWIGLSWLLVVALYNVVGSRPNLLWRCVRAHILSGGVASAISLAIYGMALFGVRFTNMASGGRGRSLVTESGEGFRLAGVAYEPLFLAFYLQTVIPITVVALLAYPRWIPRWLSGACLLAQLMALLLTVSAGGWAGALLGLSLLAPAKLIHRVPRRTRAALVTGVLVIASLALVVAFSQKPFAAIAANAAGKILAGGDRVRQGEWEAGIRMVEASPLTGMGPGLASYHFPRYHPWLQSQLALGLPEVNNLYLNELATGGIVGFVLFGCLLLKAASVPLKQLLRWGPRRVPILAALSASLVGCLVQYMSLNPLFLIYFSAAVGLAFAAARAATTGALEPDPARP